MVTTKNMDNSIALIQIHMKKYKEYAGFTEQEKEHLFGIVEQELELLYRKIRIIEKMTTQEYAMILRGMTRGRIQSPAEKINEAISRIGRGDYDKKTIRNAMEDIIEELRKATIDLEIMKEKMV